VQEKLLTPVIVKFTTRIFGQVYKIAYGRGTSMTSTLTHG
jgi:hypothetical protein